MFGESAIGRTGNIFGIPTTDDIFKPGINYIRPFGPQLDREENFLKNLISSSGGNIEVGRLRKTLLTKQIKQEPEELTAKGTLFPGVLMCSGWWERNIQTKDNKKNNTQEKNNEIQWKNSIQAWLYHGFEQWAPSIDISFNLPDEQKPYLYAQLGSGDEADSILLVVPWEKAKGIRGFLKNRFEHGDGLAIETKVTGALIHKDQLSIPDIEKKKLKQWGKAFQYCLYLNPESRQHTIDITTEDAGSYSGYLWQCLAPKTVLAENRKPKLNEVYFIWEHTDFTQPDTVKYNLDSLTRKVQYIGNRINDEPVLLHKSSEMVPGDSLYKPQEFYDYIMEGSQSNKD
jgi:hypothetical protein